MHWLEGVVTFHGRADNLALREAALVALAFNFMMVVVAIVSIAIAIPAGRGQSR
jgi:DHA2 family multidrug resistance protein-like MFS transporter